MFKRSHESEIIFPISEDEEDTRVENYVFALEAISKQIPIPIPDLVEVVGDDDSGFSVIAASDIKKRELVMYYTGEKLLIKSSRGKIVTHAARISAQRDFVIDGFITRVARSNKYADKFSLNSTNFNFGMGSLINSCFDRTSSFISESLPEYARECNLLLNEYDVRESVRNESGHFELLSEMSNQPYTREHPRFLILPFVARRDINEGEELQWRYPYDDDKQESLMPLTAASASSSTSRKQPKRRVVPVQLQPDDLP